MSFKEIKELRQAGKLEEALQMANQALEVEPDNIWNKRAAAWVYYDFLKKYSQLKSFESFKGNLIKIKDLQLPEDEKMIYDNCAWQIGSMVFSLQKENPINYSLIDELFEIIRDFHFTKPSEPYTFIYKAFHKGYKAWSNYLAFADWWNFDNLRPEDYLKEEFNGKKNMSITEQAYIAYSSKLIDGEVTDIYNQSRVIDVEKTKSFLPKLEDIIEKHPDYLYPPYFKAKLLLALGNKENALSAFLPFAKQKRNDFWVWELMAEIFADDEEKQFACYCKALSLKTREDFLVKLKQTFANILVNRKMYDEAKTEIQQIISTREKHGWKAPSQLTQWAEQEWYKAAKGLGSNNKLYLEYSKVAEEILFSNIPEEIVVVEFVNKNRGILNFVKNKEKYGFFKYSNHISEPEIGDVLRVRLEEKSDNNFYKVLTIKTGDLTLDPEAIKEFEGILRKTDSKNFGFVNDIFIAPNMIGKQNLENGQKIKGISILSYNKSKNEWGWKAIKIY